MEKADLRGLYHRLTFVTSDQYPQKERLGCLKECFEELAKEPEFLSIEEVSEIIDFVHTVLTRHADEITNRSHRPNESN